MQTSAGSAEQRVIGYYPTYLGLALRLVARVKNYAGWDDLCARYDMTECVAHAKHFAKAAEHYLFKNPANPETSSSTTADLPATAAGAGEPGAASAAAISSPAVFFRSLLIVPNRGIIDATSLLHVHTTSLLKD